MKLRQKPISCGPGGKRRIFGLFSLIVGFEWGIIKACFSAFKALKKEEDGQAVVFGVGGILKRRVSVLAGPQG